MDAAYDASAIVAQSKALGHVPLIDPNFRGKHDLKIERNTEVARRKLINIADPAAILYKFRTMVVGLRLKLRFSW